MVAEKKLSFSLRGGVKILQSRLVNTKNFFERSKTKYIGFEFILVSQKLLETYYQVHECSGGMEEVPHFHYNETALNKL